VSGHAYIPAGRSASGRKASPNREGADVFDGVPWREVERFHFARLSAFGSQMSMASFGVAVIGGRLVGFAGY
jgi:hypothetical protein